jgi:hypothetical protein
VKMLSSDAFMSRACGCRRSASRVRARPLGGKVPGWFGRRRTG